jgi:drug/metabolite transporter (DMT)-like permease
MKTRELKAMILAVLAAVFYAISTPVSKIILKSVGPTMTASMLYLGAGIGIGILFLLKGRNEPRSARLCRSDLPYTIGMILLDISAPILLMNGISRTTAANASLLNNFEIVATSILAFIIFREKISKRMCIALLLVILSSLILSFEGGSSLSFSTGSLLVLGAATCWGLENNCTRMISQKSTYEIVILKGVFSGTGALVVALILGEKIPDIKYILLIFAVGFVAYGMSIFVYIRAQSVLGAAKTSAFYALAPFIGAFISFLLLGEKPDAKYIIALLVMLAGTFFAVIDTLKYSHSHIHSHTVHHLRNGKIETEVITHEHSHSHIGPGLAHHHTHKEEL